jgi:ATP-dependent HslUV protease ATP-binding subunit HslU
MTELTPQEIVSELDRFIIGQNAAKRAVAVALRNRWRRNKLEDNIREEVYPKNILMIGPTGVGKTEIARRLATLAKAPFLKVEATKFTEVGYVGRDVDQIIRDLLDISIVLVRKEMREQVYSQAVKEAEMRVILAISGTDAREQTIEMFRKKLKNGDLDETIIELEITDNSSPIPTFEIPGQPGANLGMLNISDLFGKALGPKLKKQKMKVIDSYKKLLDEESDKLLDEEKIIKTAVERVENHGIVFLDEIDKVCNKSGGNNSGVSREGVQRDLLPLIEGTTVSTKHGSVKTDHVLFIASGAFHIAKPSDLLPELQGRLPIRVELSALTKVDFEKILTDTENSLTRQYSALMNTENIIISFESSGIQALANLAEEVNLSVENIGARRLYTILERVFEDLSYTAPDRSGETVIVNEAFVEKNLGELSRSVDLSRYVL